MKATKALPLHWEKTDGYYTYTPVVIIATDGASERCILSTTNILVYTLLMTEACKHFDLTTDKLVCQEFLDADYEIVERADGIFEVVYNEKHYPLNERLRISYQSTPQEEAAAKAREEELIQNAECCLPLTLSLEEKERLKAEYNAAHDAYQEYLKPLVEAEEKMIEAETKAAEEYLKTLPNPEDEI